ncbi:MAG: hypothetical protein ACN6OC_10895 [Alcaligenes sp.]
MMIAVALKVLLVSAEEPEHILQSPEHVRAQVIRAAEAPRPGDHVEAQSQCAGLAKVDMAMQAVYLDDAHGVAFHVLQACLGGRMTIGAQRPESISLMLAMWKQACELDGSKLVEKLIPEDQLLLGRVCKPLIFADF